MDGIFVHSYSMTNFSSPFLYERVSEKLNICQTWKCSITRSIRLTETVIDLKFRASGSSTTSAPYLFCRFYGSGARALWSLRNVNFFVKPYLLPFFPSFFSFFFFLFFCFGATNFVALQFSIYSYREHHFVRNINYNNRFFLSLLLNWFPLCNQCLKTMKIRSETETHTKKKYFEHWNFK